MDRGLKRNSIAVILGTLIFVSVFTLSAPFAKKVSGYVEYLPELFSTEKRSAVIGETAIFVSIADTMHKRIKGLSGKDGLKELEGMFFIFDENGNHGIWMKDMLFAIDIIWLNDLHEIIYIEENVSPDTYPEVFTSNKESRYVLELNAGFVDTYNLRKGDLLRGI